MAKRFTDTDKWKKPFIRGLQGPYKLLWLYILDDCDHAGIWQVDFEVARIRIGEHVDKQEALNIFGPRVEVFGNGSKWFLKDFIDFQYGQLSEKNRLHISVINILQKNELGAYKPLPRGQGQGTIQGQGNGQGEGQGQGTPDEDEILNEYKNWSREIIDGNDHIFQQSYMSEQFVLTPQKFAYWVQDHYDLVCRYPKMRPPTQQAFRNSVLKHLRENKDRITNGKSNGTEKFRADLERGLANIEAKFANKGK